VAPAALIAPLACSGGSGGTGGAGGSGGAGGGPCYPYAGDPTRSTVTGAGFDTWEGESVSGEFVPAQSFGSGRDYATVVSGAFSLTASTCTALEWHIIVGDSGDHEINCSTRGASITPADCWCSLGPGWNAGRTSDHDCAAFDGGTRDAPASD
jgi:hypothetical protein